MQAFTRRQYIHHLLMVGGRDQRASRIVDTMIVVLIVLNVIAVVLVSVPELAQAHAEAFWAFEAFSSAVFLGEYLLRVWSCVEAKGGRYAGRWGRIKYMMTPMAIIDLLAFLPFYLALFFDADFRILRVFRLLRILKLGRYSSSMDVLASVVRQEAGAFGITSLIMMVVILLASGGIYIFEYEAQPEKFGSIPQAIWWSIATLTTVGYGDVTPVTALGKAFGTLVMICGVGMVALPTGILSSAFSEELRRRREHFVAQVEEAAEDGVIDAEESAQLARLKQELGISTHDANHIMMRVSEVMDEEQGPMRCPHCGKCKNDPVRSMPRRSDFLKRR